jgi:hypothetical protein
MTWDQQDTDPGIAQARAGAPDRPSKTAKSSVSTEELDLADGTQLLGIVSTRRPGEYAVLITAAGEQHLVPWRLLKGEAAAGSSEARPAAVSGTPGDARRAQRGTVVLKTGETLMGVLIEQRPGQFVTIDLDDGTERTISWDRVSEVSSSTHTVPPGP